MSQVRVTAIIGAYTADAMTDEFEDGFVCYDAVSVRVEAPAPWAGQTLDIMIDRPQPPDSYWRMPGTRVRFSVDKGLLEEDVVLGVGALRDVTIEV